MADNIWITKKCIASICACQSFAIYHDFGVYECDISNSKYNDAYQNYMNEYYGYEYEMGGLSTVRVGDSGVLVGNFKSKADQRYKHNGEWVKILAGSKSEGWTVANKKNEKFKIEPTNLIHKEMDPKKRFKLNDEVIVKGLPDAKIYQPFPSEDIATWVQQTLDDIVSKKPALWKTQKKKIVEYFKQFTWQSFKIKWEKEGGSSGIKKSIIKATDSRKFIGCVIKLLKEFKFFYIQIIKPDPLNDQKCVIANLYLPDDEAWPVRLEHDKTEHIRNIAPKFLTKYINIDVDIVYPFFFGIYRPPINMMQNFERITNEYNAFMINEVIPNSHLAETDVKSDLTEFENKWKNYQNFLIKSELLKKKEGKKFDHSSDLTKSEAFIIFRYTTNSEFSTHFRSYWRDGTISQNEVKYMFDAIYKALHKPNRWEKLNEWIKKVWPLDWDGKKWLYHGTKADISGLKKKQSDFKAKKQAIIKKMQQIFDPKNQQQMAQIETEQGKIQFIRGPMSWTNVASIAHQFSRDNAILKISMKKLITSFDKDTKFGEARKKVMGFLANEVVNQFTNKNHEMEVILSDFDAASIKLYS
eukprot:511195_1